MRKQGDFGTEEEQKGRDGQKEDEESEEMKLNRFAVSWTTEASTERREYSSGLDGEDDVGDACRSGKKE